MIASFWRFFYCHSVSFKYHPSWLLDPDAGIIVKEKLTIIFNFKNVFTKQHKKATRVLGDPEKFKERQGRTQPPPLVLGVGPSFIKETYEI